MPTETFVHLTVTNALSPMRVVETLQDLVAPEGTIAVMSSGRGSVANNDNGGFEVYRASKSALNQLMRSFAARHVDDPRTLLLMAPGWVKTDLGGPAARLTTGQSIPRRGRHDRGAGRQGRTPVPGPPEPDRPPGVQPWKATARSAGCVHQACGAAFRARGLSCWPGCGRGEGAGAPSGAGVRRG
ncbi:SDR family oxidoreductase [Streptomyces sp. NPDC059818]|uniref:SDR family oxidoreductase n=1 Tax=Streptomyces sp. NPDC059818 TaxID=3346962 RepID=UPI0036504ED9